MSLRGDEVDTENTKRREGRVTNLVMPPQYRHG